MTAVEQQHRGEEQHRGVARARPAVLLIEHDPGAAQELGRHLEAAGYTVITTGARPDGPRAVATLIPEAAAEACATLVDELQRSNDELTAFGYSVSHDLRAPVRAISGFSGIVLNRYGDQLDGTAREYVCRINAAALRMHAMIEDLLRLSRLGRGEPCRETVDVSALAHEVISELRQADPLREVQVTIEDGITVRADPAQLRMVLHNLLGNAWKFTAKRSGARIHVGRPEGDAPSFFVRDNGAGFDPACADMLFAPFQRLHGRDEYPGNGIGLAIVARIVHRHHGRVEAVAAPGEGATFTVTLPVPPARIGEQA